MFYNKQRLFKVFNYLIKDVAPSQDYVSGCVTLIQPCQYKWFKFSFVTILKHLNIISPTAAHLTDTQSCHFPRFTAAKNRISSVLSALQTVCSAFQWASCFPGNDHSVLTTMTPPRDAIRTTTLHEHTSGTGRNMWVSVVISYSNEFNV